MTARMQNKEKGSTVVLNSAFRRNRLLLSVVFAVFAQILPADGVAGLRDWSKSVLALRPPVPEASTRSTVPVGSKHIQNASPVDGFAHEKEVMAKNLSFDVPADSAWTRVLDTDEETFSECLMDLGNGVTGTFGAYGQLGNYAPFYLTIAGLAPSSPAEAADVRTFVLSEVCGNSASVAVKCIPHVLHAGEVEIRDRRTTFDAPFEKFWFVFVDDQPQANWMHPCRYIFVSEDLSAYAVVYRMAPPRVTDASTGDVLRLEGGATWSVNVPTLQSVVSNVWAVSNSYLSNGLQYGGDTDHSYFILISGGHNPWSNGIRFWSDTAMFYSTLTLKYNVPKDHIRVYMSDGTSPAKDACLDANGEVLVSSPTDLDGDGISDIAGAATWSNVKTAFSTWQSKLTSSDQLVVFMSTHGGYEGVLGTYDAVASLFSPDGSGDDANGHVAEVRDDEFHEWTKEFKCPVALAIECCYSGGFVDDIVKTSNRFITTAANHKETSRGWSSKADVSHWQNGEIGWVKACNCWTIPFVSAFRGYIPYPDVGGYPWMDLEPCSADTSGDGKISMVEAAEFARAYDEAALSGYEHPQIGGDGSSFFLVKSKTNVKPDLVAATPSGWSSPLIVSRSDSATSDDLDLKTYDSVIVRCAWQCQLAESHNEEIKVALFVDGTRWITFGDIGERPGIVYDRSWEIGRLSAGPHTFRMQIDPDNVVAEADESNNIFEKTVTIIEGAVSVGHFTVENGELIAWDGQGSTDLVIPTGVKSIGSGVFSGSSVTSIRLSDSVEVLGFQAFSTCYSLTNVIFGIGLKKVDDSCFFACSGLKGAFYVPEGVERIGDDAFEYVGCSRIVLPSTLRSLGEKVFLGCRSLREVYFKSDAPRLEATWGSFSGGSPKIFIYASEDIVTYAPSGSRGWKTVGSTVLPSVWPTEDGEDARSIQTYSLQAPPLVLSAADCICSAESQNLSFECEGISNWTVSSDSNWITVTTSSGSGKGTVRYSVRPNMSQDDRFGTITVTSGKTSASFKVRQRGVRHRVGDYVLEGSLLVSWSGPMAGDQVVGDIDLVIPDGFGIEEIAEKAFYNVLGNKTITSVVLPKGLKKIGKYAFRLCESLTNICFNADLEEIGGNAFGSCRKLSGCLVIPPSVKRIGSHAFEYTNYTAVVLPGDLDFLNDAVFSQCPILTSVFYAGNAPKNIDSLGWTYYGSLPELTTYVPNGSTGWKDSGTSLPALWPVNGDSFSGDYRRPIRNYNPAFTVKLNRNDGSRQTKSLSFKLGADQSLPPLDAQLKWGHADFRFVGWGTAADATTAKYADGEWFLDFVEPGQTLNLFAIWEKPNDKSQTIVLQGTGWTWVSINMEPDDASFASVFKGVSFADDDVIKSSGGSATYYGGTWYPSPSTFMFVPGRAYAVKKSTAGTATVTVGGTPAVASLTVTAGWNWIGPTTDKPVSLDALKHSGGFADDDVISSTSRSSTYYGGKWYGSLQSLEPGVGYKARFDKAGTLSEK